MALHLTMLRVALSEPDGRPAAQAASPEPCQGKICAGELALVAWAGWIWSRANLLPAGKPVGRGAFPPGNFWPASVARWNDRPVVVCKHAAQALVLSGATAVWEVRAY